MTASLFANMDLVTISPAKDFLLRIAKKPENWEAFKECVPGVKRSSDKRFWVVPGTAENAYALKMLHVPFSQEARKLSISLPSIERNRIEASKAHDADIEIIGFGKSPFPFQRAGIKYAAEVKRCIVADEMGLGKTIQGLGATYITGAFPLLVVTPASNKYQWYQNEIPICLPIQTCLLADKDTTEFALSLADVVVTNYDQLVGRRIIEHNDGSTSWSSWTTEDKTEPVLSPLAEKLQKIHFRAVILDEAHYIKNNKSARTLCTFAVGQDIEYKFLLTGTPVLNRPIELYSLLKFIGMHNHFGGYWHFQNRYCGMKKTKWGMDNKGSSHELELNEKLRSLCYIRRKKIEVLKDLPPKLRTSYAVEISNRAEYKHAEDDLIEWVKMRVLKDKEFLASLSDLSEDDRLFAIRARQADKAERAERGHTMVLLTALKRLVAEGKLKSAFEWIDNFLETDQKLVVFAMHQNILASLRKRYPDSCAITSDMDVSERQKNVQRFQTLSEIPLLFGAMGTSAIASPAGIGHTLTAASNVLFLEFGWTPGHISQCEDRCHRIGQRDNVTCHYLMGKSTIDEQLVAIIERKRNVAARVEDGDEEATTQSILDELTDWLASK